MTVLIILLILVVPSISAAWVVGRGHAARRDHEAIGDAVTHDLYDRYLHDVEALTQAYLLQASSDEEWLAGIKKQASALTGIASMVRRAAEGDRRAWELLVDQYAPLIWAITSEFKLAEGEAVDVAQRTWLRLLEHIDRIPYPERVGSWLAATARNECQRMAAADGRVVLDHDEAELDAAIARLSDEHAQAVGDALSRLPGRWQRLLELLMADPAASHAEISDELGLPPASIGPTRGRRWLARLRVQLQASEGGTDNQATPYTGGR